jgi:hypothetical protein
MMEYKYNNDLSKSPDIIVKKFKCICGSDIKHTMDVTEIKKTIKEVDLWRKEFPHLKGYIKQLGGE